MHWTNREDKEREDTFLREQIERFQRFCFAVASYRVFLVGVFQI